MLKIMTSREIDASKMRYNTRVGTGKARHAQKIDTRTLWGRRDREIYNAIISDLGGADRLSELEHQVVRRAVGLALQCEQIETQLAEGKPVDIAASATLIKPHGEPARPQAPGARCYAAFRRLHLTALQR